VESADAERKKEKGRERKMKRTKKKIAVIMTAVLIIASIYQMNRVTVQAAKKAVKVGKGMYTVTSEKKKTARFDRASQKSVTTLSIPATVKIGKKTYKVTAIKANALKNNKKIRKLAIGKNVKTIGKNAFCCKNLKDITIKTTKLTMKSVGKNAFKGLNKKVVVTVPASKLEAYKKLLKARGLTGKKQVVKSDGKEKEEEDNKPHNPLNVAETKFAIGKVVMGRGTTISGFWDQKWIFTSKESSDYTVGDSVPFAMCVDVGIDAYGKWIKKEMTTNFKTRCWSDDKMFGSLNDWYEHVDQTGHTHNEFWNKGPYTGEFETWIPDMTPYGIEFNATLPEGLKCNKDSISLSYRGEVELDKSVYTAEVSGQNVKVKINNIKEEPFWTLYQNYHGGANPHNVTKSFIVSFNAEMESSVSLNNQASASATCSYAGESKILDLGRVSVLTSSLAIHNTDESGADINGADFKLYKRQENNSYKEVLSKTTNGSVFTFTGLGSGQYRLSQTTTPEGYKKTSNQFFTLTVGNNGTSVTELKVTDEDGNETSLPGGTWEYNILAASISSNLVSHPNPDKTRTVSATIKYSYDGKVNPNFTRTLSKEIQALEKDAALDTFDINAIDEEGYKLDCITVNGKKVASLPETLKDGDEVIYWYVSDDNAVKTLSATVKYYKDDVLEYQKPYSKEVKFSARTMDTDGISDNVEKFAGCKLSKIMVNGEEVNSLPKTIEDGAVVSFYYVEDTGIMKTMSVTVQYSLEGVIQEDDTFVYTQEVSASEYDGYMRNIVLPDKKYDGYQISGYYIGSKTKEYQELPPVISGSTVTVYYTRTYDDEGM